MAFRLDKDGNAHRSRPDREPWKSMLRITEAQYDALQSVPPYHRNTTTGNEMTAAEKSDADTARLPDLRKSLKAQHSAVVAEFVEQHYSAFQRLSFLALMDEARGQGLVNRRNAIQTHLFWLKSVIQALIDSDDAVDAAAIPVIAEAVTIDYAALDAADPGVTLKAVMGILD